MKVPTLGVAVEARSGHGVGGERDDRDVVAEFANGFRRGEAVELGLTKSQSVKSAPIACV
jgi:hypothetical protein